MADPLPKPDQYVEAVQNPQLCFSDAELRHAKCKLNQLQLPIVKSGNFAQTFQFDASGKSWAVRCFVRESSDRHVRYDAIARFIQNNPRPYWVKVEHQANGILVNGKRYPIVKMPWVADAVTLNGYVDRHIKSPAKLIALRDKIAEIGRDLGQMQVAHGDLQLGNILVQSSGQPVLVDYDGVYVPSMTGLAAAERGHPNFQHPFREKQFDATLDRFSLLVLFLGLTATNEARWRRYGSGENLLFKQVDLGDPDSSALFSELRADSATRDLAGRLAEIAKGGWSDIPTLDQFLSGAYRKSVPQTVVMPAPAAARLYDVVAATDREELLKRSGERVEVVGLITEVKQQRTKYGQPYAFVNFGNWQHGAFTLVLWKEALDTFEHANIDIESYEGRWVSVVGVLSKYGQYGKATRPQIYIDSPSDIRILAGEAEATRLLRPAQTPTTPIPPAAVPPTVVKRVLSDDPITKLYGKQSIGPVATTPAKPTIPTSQPTQPIPKPAQGASAGPASTKPIAPAPQVQPKPFQSPPATSSQSLPQRPSQPVARTAPATVSPSPPVVPRAALPAAPPSSTNPTLGVSQASAPAGVSSTPPITGPVAQPPPAQAPGWFHEHAGAIAAVLTILFVCWACSGVVGIGWWSAATSATSIPRPTPTVRARSFDAAATSRPTRTPGSFGGVVVVPAPTGRVDAQSSTAPTNTIVADDGIVSPSEQRASTIGKERPPEATATTSQRRATATPRLTRTPRSTPMPTEELPNTATPIPTETPTVAVIAPTSEPATPEPRPAAPRSCPRSEACITAPASGTKVYRGSSVIFQGSATHASFARYKFLARNRDTGAVGTVAEFWAPVSNGQLMDLKTWSMPKGNYTFQLVVIDTTGNSYAEIAEIDLSIE